eukprot:4123736-Amphidinium_carterae.1
MSVLRNDLGVASNIKYCFLFSTRTECYPQTLQWNEAPQVPEAAAVVTSYDAMELERLHQQALASGDAFYTDPETGYTVMTSGTLQKRGRCCGNGCRHCPYGHLNVTDVSRRSNVVKSTVLLPLSGRSLSALHADVVFFSG